MRSRSQHCGGVRYAFRRASATTLALVVGFLAAAGLYGIVDANVGTSVRHRQMFLWGRVRIRGDRCRAAVPALILLPSNYDLDVMLATEPDL